MRSKTRCGARVQQSTMSLLSRLLLYGVVLGTPFVAVAQTKPPGPQASAVEKLTFEWNDVKRKLTTAAAEFPENKYDYRPTPEVRTFAEQLLHVAFWNTYLTATAKGEKPDPKPNQLPRDKYKTKQDVVNVLGSSFDDAIQQLKGKDPERVQQELRLWTSFLEHCGEHYGQLVMYYRLNGLVPPESR